MTIQKYLDLSTVHVTPDDMDLLQTSGLYCIADYEEGAFVFLPTRKLDGEFDDTSWREAVQGAGYSERFCDLLDYARRKDVDIIRLDRDGDEDDNLSRCEEWD